MSKTPFHSKLFNFYFTHFIFIPQLVIHLVRAANGLALLQPLHGQTVYMCSTLLYSLCSVLGAASIVWMSLISRRLRSSEVMLCVSNPKQLKGACWFQNCSCEKHVRVKGRDGCSDVINKFVTSLQLFHAYHL